MARGRYGEKRKNLLAELQRKLAVERKETESLRELVEMLLKQNTELQEELDRVTNRPSRRAYVPPPTAFNPNLKKVGPKQFSALHHLIQFGTDDD